MNRKPHDFQQAAEAYNMAGNILGAPPGTPIWSQQGYGQGQAMGLYADGGGNGVPSWGQPDRQYTISVTNTSTGAAVTGFLFGAIEYPDLSAQAAGFQVTVDGSNHAALRQQLLYRPMMTAGMHVYVSAEAQLSNGIALKTFDANGDSRSRTLRLQAYTSAQNNQNNRVDLLKFFEPVSGNTAWVFTLNPSASITFNIFFASTVDPAQILTGQAPVRVAQTPVPSGIGIADNLLEQ